MKKALILASLSLALLTTACGSKDVATTNEEKTSKEPTKQTTQVKASKEDAEDESLGDYTTREGIRKLMTQSDYISRVKLTQLGDGQTELTILDNYKGSLSNIEFPQPKGLSTNKEYLIFYKDDDEGNIVPTASDAVVEVATKNDTILDYVERTYNKSSDQDSSSNGRSSRSSSKESSTKSSSQEATTSRSKSSSEDQDKTTRTSSTSGSRSSDKTPSKSSRTSKGSTDTNGSTNKVKKTTSTSSNTRD